MKKRIRYTWVKCHTGHTTEYLKFKISLGKEYELYPCESDKSRPGDYTGGYSFVIPGGPYHDHLVRKLTYIIQTENIEEPGKHRAEIITVYEESFSLGYEEQELKQIKKELDNDNSS